MDEQKWKNTSKMRKRKTVNFVNKLKQLRSPRKKDQPLHFFLQTSPIQRNGGAIKAQILDVCCSCGEIHKIKPIKNYIDQKFAECNSVITLWSFTSR